MGTAYIWLIHCLVSVEYMCRYMSVCVCVCVCVCVHGVALSVENVYMCVSKWFGLMCRVCVVSKVCVCVCTSV